MRTARTSGEYLTDVFFLALPSQGSEPAVNLERFGLALERVHGEALESLCPKRTTSG
jgi:hypothetical protein